MEVDKKIAKPSQKYCGTANKTEKIKSLKKIRLVNKKRPDKSW